jgi:hypothetical protein
MNNNNYNYFEAINDDKRSAFLSRGKIVLGFLRIDNEGAEAII